MSEVVVVGSFTARPGREAEAAEAFKALARGARRRLTAVLPGYLEATREQPN